MRFPTALLTSEVVMVLFTIGLVGFVMMMVVDKANARIDYLRMAYGLRLVGSECHYDVMFDDDTESTLLKGRINQDATAKVVVWTGGKL